MIRQSCREYRIVPISELPSEEEMLATNMIEFDRGASNAQVICIGYYDKNMDCGVDAQGNPWPGLLIAGRKGIYGAERFPLIKHNLETYKDGVNGGRTRLMQTPLAIESSVVLDDPEADRLRARLPKIMGD